MSIHTKCMNAFTEQWLASVNRINATRGEGRNKLRTYAEFKTEYFGEPYLLHLMPKTYRSVLAKFKGGVAPIRLETGRFKRLRVEDRVCHHCDEVETE